ncbi:MAG: hypothetical protein DRJ39_00265 [Thermoprotei archaeon]|nr:DUF47 family protein [Thermoproteales archaeon]RLE76451.1 MAG: hypothetical protein DRZ80_00960 [Thermoprotei archaeon]RLE86096.1 MAG: hypothetical protein DRJ39_00265 [Thermoprotei archaeon]
MRREDLSRPFKSIADQRLIEKYLEELRLLNDIIKSVYIIITQADNISKEELEKHIGIINNSKTEIELIKKDALQYISKTSPSLYHREDWLRIATKIYNATDKAGGVIYRLEYMVNKKWQIPSPIKKGLANLTDNVMKIVNEFVSALKCLTLEEAKISERFKAIDQLEKKADENYRKIIFTVLESNIAASSMFLLLNIAEMLEDISDTITLAKDDLHIILLNML